MLHYFLTALAVARPKSQVRNRKNGHRAKPLTQHFLVAGGGNIGLFDPHQNNCKFLLLQHCCRLQRQQRMIDRPQPIAADNNCLAIQRANQLPGRDNSTPTAPKSPPPLRLKAPRTGPPTPESWPRPPERHRIRRGRRRQRLVKIKRIDLIQRQASLLQAVQQPGIAARARSRTVSLPARSRPSPRRWASSNACQDSFSDPGVRARDKKNFFHGTLISLVELPRVFLAVNDTARAAPIRR